MAKNACYPTRKRTPKSGPRWGTDQRTGHAHLVLNEKAVCEAPVRRGMIWYPTKPSHSRCVDCRAIEGGDTVEHRNELRNARAAAREAEYRSYND